MKNTTYKSEKGSHLSEWLKARVERMETIFAAIAFAEEGEVKTAKDLLKERGDSRCKDGYYYDEKRGLCVARS